MAADLHRRAAALFPCLRREDLLNAWSGLRPCLPDGAPLIATHPAVENLHLNIGHGRYGICMAPGAASHLRRIMHSPQEAKIPSPGGMNGTPPLDFGGILFGGRGDSGDCH